MISPTLPRTYTLASSWYLEVDLTFLNCSTFKTETGRYLRHCAVLFLTFGLVYHPAHVLPINPLLRNVTLNVFVEFCHTSGQDRRLSAAVLMCISGYRCAVLWKETAFLAPSNPSSRDGGMGTKGRLASETSCHPEPKQS